MVEHKDEKFILLNNQWYKITCKKLKNEKIEESIKIDNKKYILTEKDLKSPIKYKKGKYKEK